MPISRWLVFWALAVCAIVFSYAAFATCTIPSANDAEYNGSLPIEPPAITASNPTVPAETGVRKVFDPSNSSSNGAELNASDLSSMNRDAPNLTATYTNKTYKVAVDLPYNFDWGKPNYVLPPYLANGDTVSYGTLEMLEGAIGRSQSLTIGKRTTVEDVRASIKDRAMTGKPIESTVRGIPTISFMPQDIPCRIVIGIGKSATYTFQDCRHDIKQLEPEAILSTIRPM